MFVLLTDVGDCLLPGVLDIWLNLGVFIIGSQERLYVLISLMEYRNCKVTHSVPFPQHKAVFSHAMGIPGSKLRDLMW